MPHVPTSSTPASPDPAGRVVPGRLHRVARDYAYIVPGLPLAVFSFATLVGLTVVSVGTFVVWIGAWLMPLTLRIASAFARLSRRRLRGWGVVAAPADYRTVRHGFAGAMQVMGDTRRWLDLVFETLIALPLRLFTFIVGVTWTAIAVAGVTHWAWRPLLPAGSSGWEELLRSLNFPAQLPQSDRGIYLLDSGISLVVGLVFLLTLPNMMRGLATLDASLTTTLLSNAGTAVTTGTSPGRTAVPRGRRTTGTGWTWVTTTFAAVVLIAVGWPVLAVVYDVPVAIAMVLAVSHSASIVVAVRWPRVGIGLSSLASLGTMLATSAVAAQAPWPWPVTAMLAQSLMVVVVALRHSWFWALTAWAAGATLTVVAFGLIAGGLPSGNFADGVVLVAVTAGFALLGVLEQLWRRSASRVRQAEELSVEEMQLRRDLEERNRIARELHDVVAHSMSVINVQASTVRYRKPGIDEAVQREFDDIAESSRQALGEMRSLLAVLRNHDAAPTAPAPKLADIQDLVEATRASGASISYSGVDTDVPPTVGLTAYRVIQEALSNALRHAPGASIEVTTAIEDDGRALVVDVVNSAAQSDTPATPGAGLGLAGIRERVASLGATVLAAPTPSGGFSVSTSLPLDDGRSGTDR